MHRNGPVTSWIRAWGAAAAVAAAVVVALGACGGSSSAGPSSATAAAGGASSAQRPDACQVVTGPDVQAVVGAPVSVQGGTKEDSDTQTDCTYVDEGAPGTSVVVVTAAFATHSGAMNDAQSTARTFGMQALNGMGYPAWIGSDRSLVGTDVTVVKDNRVLHVQAVQDSGTPALDYSSIARQVAARGIARI